MAATKVKSSASASSAPPRIIRITKANAGPPVSYEPDLVWVRVLPNQRGFYAVKEVMRDSRDNIQRVVRNPIIRNEGDVFEMDTADMRRMRDGQLLPVLMPIDGKGMVETKQYPHAGMNGTVEIATERGDAEGVTFELPSWVELAAEDGGEYTPPEGHKTSFGKLNGEVL